VVDADEAEACSVEGVRPCTWIEDGNVAASHGRELGRRSSHRRLPHHAADAAHREALAVRGVGSDDVPIRPPWRAEHRLWPRASRPVPPAPGLHRHQRQRPCS
jgi:hypothetical protein